MLCDVIVFLILFGITLGLSAAVIWMLNRYGEQWGLHCNGIPMKRRERWWE